MASIAREALARVIVQWMTDSEERSWARENRKATLFTRYVRFCTWMSAQASAASNDLIENQGLRNKIVSNWLLNLPSWLEAFEVAGVVALEDALGLAETQKELD